MSVDGFNYDNVLIRMLNRLGDLIILSLTFVLFSLPIVTIGASITALYYTAMKSLALEDGYIFKFFVKSFKDNFKQSTILWLISVAVLTVLGVDVWFWVKQWIEYRTDFARPMMIISVVLLFLAVMIVLYVFPLQAKFDNKIKVQLRNAFLLSIKFFPTTILMMAILAVVLWMFYYFTVFAVFGFAFIGFGILGFILGYFMLKCFKPYLEISKKTESDEAFDDDESEENSDVQSDEKTDDESEEKTNDDSEEDSDDNAGLEDEASKESESETDRAVEE